jgi:hypothetical protein
MKNFRLLLVTALVTLILSTPTNAGIIHQPGRPDGPDCSEVMQDNLCYKGEEESLGTSPLQHEVYAFDSGASEWVFIP